MKRTGLHRVGAVWHMDKTVRFGTKRRRIRGSTGCTNQQDALIVLAQEIKKAKEELLYGTPPSHTFKEAARRYLVEQNQAGKKSVLRQHQNLESVMPLIGDLPVNEVHQGVFDPWIKAQRGRLRSGTIRRILRIVTAVLNKCARVYRDGSQPWLLTVPLLTCPEMDDTKQAYPLSWDEERALLRNLPVQLKQIAKFALWTGARDQEICMLEWKYEQGDVFVIPKEKIKNKEDRVIVIGHVARQIIETQRFVRGESPYVFPGVDGGKLAKIGTKAWRDAWIKAGLPDDPDIRKGPHNLRHTFGRRLRAAGVSLETRKALLGHKTGDITTHYSAAEIRELVNAINSIKQGEDSPILRVVK